MIASVNTYLRRSRYICPVICTFSLLFLGYKLLTCLFSYELWNEAQPVLNQLNEILSDLHPMPHHNKRINHLTSNDCLERQKLSIEAKLSEAIHLSKNVYAMPSSISLHLFKIKANLNCYIDWIGRLPHTTGVLCLSSKHENNLIYAIN